MLMHTYKYLNSLLCAIPTFSNKCTVWVTSRNLLTGCMDYQHTLSSKGEGSPRHTFCETCGLCALVYTSANWQCPHGWCNTPEFTLHTWGVCPCVVHSVTRFGHISLQTVFGCQFIYILICQDPRCCAYFYLTDSPFLIVHIYF